MGARREGRESAMQFLFLRDLGGADDPDALQAFFKIRNTSPSARSFCKQLIEGVVKIQDKIDSLIQNCCHNYQLNRIAPVDRNILRVAIYELLANPEIPPAVAINEAIEIAKKYGTNESARFVNGILDCCRKSIVSQTIPSEQSSSHILIPTDESHPS
ncbi:MAG: transcription antitermination factor NusB [Chthoniobacterales bacterium]|nr:transcription antitermination factor NusB [Chthoniobacterales bacterium]MCX7712873.1 transcription antitermination factor NusB [Chthoniobacterales bacterium]